MQLTSSPRRALGLLAAGTIGLSTGMIGLTGVAQAAPSGPLAPTIVAVEGLDGGLIAFFESNDPGDPDVAPDAEYWEYSLDGGDTYEPAAVQYGLSGFDGGFEVDGLVNGTTYSLTLRGVDEGLDPVDPVDDVGGDASAASPVTPGVAPGDPGSPTVTVGPASITVSWTAAAQTSFPITGYLVGSYVSFGEGGGIDRICETSAAVLTCTVTKPVGYKYSVYVQAVDSEGNRSAENVLAPVTIPAAAVPTAVPAKSGDLTLAPSSAGPITPGKKITVSGSGYAPNSSVDVIIYSTPQVLTTVIADGTGAFSVEVTVPAGLAAGSHTVVASGVDASGVLRYVTLPITVTADGVATLANTGADVTVPAVAGLATLGLGAGLIVFARRRRTAA
ncbi:LPXTG cell wall anchor domain-containing protein [Blastococcus tunisiensis]|uniref:LPXTG-motif cell wall anchor domain-containing protein n=1 Tax=Blastococcus tunisiensis TaxID=1798228 RepID=A0A1I2J4U3_9ACTN|nr:fibronectin type III domain-containing protein [Blastococcus sp. DSM 46838]SFF49725.1 LPXTG-motif cell wall anchor domain-containing protein [Blastococcus sp. DSM 46838]